MSRRRRACEALVFPHALTYARPYVNGWMCANHTPNAFAGRPEAPPGYGRPPAELPPRPQSASALADQRAIASGKRRSTPAAYRAAQAAVAVDHRKDLNL